MSDVTFASAERLLARDRADDFISLTDARGVAAPVGWGEFWDWVDGLRPFVRDISSGDAPTLIFSLSQLASIACFFAVIAEGGLPAFFPPPNRLQDSRYYRDQQRSSIGKIAPAGICVFDDDAADALRALDAHPTIIPSSPFRGDGPAALRAFHARLGRRGPLFLQHSSGTTGTKKAVEISGAMLGAQFDALWPRIERRTGRPARVASWLPLYHDMGLLATLLLPLLGGARMSLIDPVTWVSKPQLLLDVIERDRASVAWMPNFAYRHYVRMAPMLKARDLSSMRLWVNCSEPCRSPDVEMFETRFAAMGVAPDSVHGSYAMAETVFAITQSTGERRTLAVAADLVPGMALREGDRRVQSSGAVLPGFAIAAYADGKPLPDGAYGEIGVRGPCVFAGYRGIDARGSSIAADGTYMTGDLGALLDGELYVFGRSKETAIVNGKNVFCGDVEDAITQVAGIKPGRAAAFGIDNERSGSQELVIVAELAGPESEGLDHQIKALVQDLFGVLPRDVLLVPDRWLVKSTSGKVSRSENIAKYKEFRDAHH